MLRGFNIVYVLCLFLEANLDFLARAINEVPFNFPGVPIGVNPCRVLPGIRLLIKRYLYWDK